MGVMNQFTPHLIHIYIYIHIYTQVSIVWDYMGWFLGNFQLDSQHDSLRSPFTWHPWQTNSEQYATQDGVGLWFVFVAPMREVQDAVRAGKRMVYIFSYFFVCWCFLFFSLGQFSLLFAAVWSQNLWFACFLLHFGAKIFDLLLAFGFWLWLLAFGFWLLAFGFWLWLLAGL